MKALTDEAGLGVMNLPLTAKVPLRVYEVVDASSLPQYLVSRHLVIPKKRRLSKSKRKELTERKAAEG